MHRTLEAAQATDAGLVVTIDSVDYTLSWRWNGRYTLFASVILLPVYGSMAPLFG